MRNIQGLAIRTAGNQRVGLAVTLFAACLMVACQGSEDKVAGKNTTEGAESLQVKAEKGDKSAQFALGVRFETGDGVVEDVSRAAYWYEKAASAGHLGAIKNLATFYYRGNGVRQNYETAFSLYKRASELGDVGALNSLGAMYSDGLGVEKNYSEALRLYRKASDQDYPYAQTNIGIMYRFGWGVKQDFVEAYAWWLVADSKGDSFAGDNLKKLQTKLSKDSVSRAEIRAQQIRHSIEDKKKVLR